MIIQAAKDDVIFVTFNLTNNGQPRLIENNETVQFLSKVRCGEYGNEGTRLISVESEIGDGTSNSITVKIDLSAVNAVPGRYGFELRINRYYETEFHSKQTISFYDDNEMIIHPRGDE